MSIASLLQDDHSVWKNLYINSINFNDGTTMSSATNSSSGGITPNSTDTLTNKTITDPSNTVTAKKLFTATTSVDISTATAPTTGQVLTAINSTSANWQTPTTGSGPVPNVNQTVLNTAVTINSPIMIAVTGMTCTLTTTRSNSKILINVNTNSYCASTFHNHMTVYRNGTNVVSSWLLDVYFSTGGTTTSSQVINFLDTPNVASGTLLTYTVYYGGTTQDVILNNTNGSSWIGLIEQ